MLTELNRHYYSTPKSYLDLIAIYQDMLINKKDELNQNLGRLTSGITKLMETYDTIDIMKDDLR